jgi:hypothetical protein
MRIPASAAAFALLVAALAFPDISAQTRREPRRVGLDEHAELNRLVDAAATGNPAGGNAFLRWTPHFLRGPEGKTYVPFTLRIEEAPGSFRAAAMWRCTCASRRGATKGGAPARRRACRTSWASPAARCR